jgi:peptidyl-prolyl cis-trans isomerase D
MLQKLRDKTTGWIAIVILVMLVVPFAFFGVENYFTAQVSSYVAKVNGEEIDQNAFRIRFDQLRQQQRQMMGEQFDAREFESAENKRRVLDRLIDEALMRQSAKRLGVVIPASRMQKEILAIPAFQVDGKFDQNQYRSTLAQQGYTPVSFDKQLHSDLEMSVVPSEVSSSAFVTDDYVARYFALRDQTRTFDYLTLPAPAPESLGAVSDADITAYYEAHKDVYVSDETVQVEYVELDAKTLEVPVTVDESTLQQRYEEQKSRFVEPEQRLASHILLTVALDADADKQKEVQAKAQALATQARAEGADFAALAKANSEDPGSRNTGGDLGWIEKGITDPAFESALYAMQPGTVSDPVKGADGWHVIQLRDVRAEAGKPFADVRAELEREYLDGERERMFSDLSAKLDEAIYRTPATLETAAKELSLTVKQSGVFSRNGGEGIAANPAVVAAAFADTVRTGGNVSEVVSIGEGKSVALRVIQHNPSATLPIEAVRDRVRDALIAERAVAKAKTDADALLARAQADGALDAIASERGIEIQKAEAAGRAGALVDPAVAVEAFRLPHPTGDKPSIGMATLAGNSYALIALRAVMDGDPEKTPAETRTMLRDQISQAIGRVESDAYLKAQRQAAEIEVVETRL